jgi:hypothetical protein
MREKFAEQLNTVVPRLAEMVARCQAEALAARSQRWAASADDLRFLEESVFQAAAALAAAPHEAHEFSDAVLQSLDFLLRTAAAALRTREPGDSEVLVRLTSDRAEAREAIRALYEESQPEAVPAARNFTLDLISLYFRCAYFVNHIAERLARDIAAEAGPNAA